MCELISGLSVLFHCFYLFLCQCRTRLNTVVYISFEIGNTYL